MKALTKMFVLLTIYVVFVMNVSICVNAEDKGVTASSNNSYTNETYTNEMSLESLEYMHPQKITESPTKETNNDGLSGSQNYIEFIWPGLTKYSAVQYQRLTDKSKGSVPWAGSFYEFVHKVEPNLVPIVMDYKPIERPTFIIYEPVKV